MVGRNKKLIMNKFSFVQVLTYCDHTTVSGGFVGGSNYPTQLMFTTLEKARQNKPENDYSTGNSRKYYIKEVEID